MDNKKTHDVKANRQNNMKKGNKVKQSAEEITITVKNGMSISDFMFIEWYSKFKVKELISVINKTSGVNELYLLENGIWLYELKNVPDLSYDEILYLSVYLLSTAKSLGGFINLTKYFEEL